MAKYQSATGRSGVLKTAVMNFKGPSDLEGSDYKNSRLKSKLLGSKRATARIELATCSLRDSDLPLKTP